jgi:hypothetical protein
VAEGVAHAPDASVTTAGNRADCDTAANSAARLTVVKLLIAKNIATSPTDAITFLSRPVDQRTVHEQGGPPLPSLCSPLLFFAFMASAASRGREPACEKRDHWPSPIVLARGLKTTLSFERHPRLIDAWPPRDIGSAPDQLLDRLGVLHTAAQGGE